MNSRDEYYQCDTVKNEPQTSTPMKMQLHYLQNTANGSLVVNETYQESNSKGTRFLGVKAVSILNQWLIDNKNYPYPDESTTDYLAQQAEISSKQVKKWFANKRVRSQLCCKTVHRNKRRFKEESSNYEYSYIKEEDSINRGEATNNKLSSSTSTSSLSPSSGSSLYMSSPSPPQPLLQHQQNSNKKSNLSMTKSKHFPSKNLENMSGKLNDQSRNLNGNQQSWSFNNFNGHTTINHSQRSQGNTPSYIQSVNNASLLKSMAYYNPVMMMNLLFPVSTPSSSSSSSSPPFCPPHLSSSLSSSSSSSSSSCSYSSSSHLDTSPPSLSQTLNSFPSKNQWIKSQPIETRYTDENGNDLSLQNQNSNVNINDPVFQSASSNQQQNNKNYSNLLMLMMMSKCNMKGAFQPNLIQSNSQFNYKNSSEVNSANLNSSPMSLSSSLLSSFATSNTPKCQVKIEHDIDNKGISSLMRSKFDKKTNFAIISTLID